MNFIILGTCKIKIGELYEYMMKCNNYILYVIYTIMYIICNIYNIIYYM